MNAVQPSPAQDAPVLAGWITLVVTWILFLIPFPGFGILGWVANVVALVLSIVVLAKGATGHGIAQLVCALLVSPVVYFIGLALFVGALAMLDQM
ncbi:hypothetical protein [Arenimonas fontis]|uniref:Uncharacterized protein n=1 Tax=Arenimonas fontis TaxID=2608255 RepID=A0A5B2ZEU4_9GAMM|nr:hypothetical protein [Arenimonas fontis]KAA2285602.1 hypothetical protein F0415_02890 [Arenimonas fontis]